ncbi:MAG: MBL fold metallo-hydrolase [Melioribacteraceae bacterium]|nr:MBL fold metallo-hydrolase [Melioribacteraceae bacterium]
MKIGKYELISIETGTLGLDGGAMYGVVPKPLWERTSPSDEKNRIKLVTRNLILKSESKTILIDTGVGNFWDDKFNKIYNIDHSVHDLIPALANAEIKPDQITDVILTHLHFDHTGGSVIKENEKWLPAFPNAKYHVQKAHYDWAFKPSDKDKASFIKERFVPLNEEGILNLLDNSTEFDDGIEFILVDGHTFSMQMVKISDSSKTLLYCADLMPLSSHIQLPYIMAYDLQPLKTLEEKKKILSKAVEENWILFFEHDPEIAAATITHSMNGFGFDEIYEELP